MTVSRPYTGTVHQFGTFMSEKLPNTSLKFLKIKQKQQEMTKARANITVYRSTRSTRYSGSSLILSCLTFSFSCGIVYSRVKRTLESEQKKTYVYLIKRKIKKKMLVYVPGTYISPFVLALQGGVNSNPLSRDVIIEDGKSETGPKQ